MCFGLDSFGVSHMLRLSLPCPAASLGSSWAKGEALLGRHVGVIRMALGALPWVRCVTHTSSCSAVTVICAAPGADGAWWRAQVVASYEETNEVEIRYVDYGGYKRVKVDVLRQIR